MKKIAILTLPLNNNYGGILQNYALQKVLKSLGFDPVTIDRHHEVKLHTKLKLGYFKSLLLYLLKRGGKPRLRAFFMSRRDSNKIRKDIVGFVDRNIKITDRIYSDRLFKNLFFDNEFYGVIVGSDQVWRPKYSPKILTYYLDFLCHDKGFKKIAYAASFGTQDWEYSNEQTERCRELVKQFDGVSVREEGAVSIVSEKFDRQAEFVLDPTLLLDKIEYINLFELKCLPDNGGVYTYILDEADWKAEVVETVCQTLGKPRFNNQPRKKIFDPSSGGLENYKIPSIEGWLKGFFDSEFVITDSYHGTLFSIIFNKPFIVLLNKNRGESRFYSILGQLNLNDRLISEYDNAVIGRLVTTNINYKSVNNKVAALKLKSLSFLKAALFE